MVSSLQHCSTHLEGSPSLAHSRMTSFYVESPSYRMFKSWHTLWCLWSYTSSHQRVGTSHGRPLRGSMSHNKLKHRECESNLKNIRYRGTPWTVIESILTQSLTVMYRAPSLPFLMERAGGIWRAELCAIRTRAASRATHSLRLHQGLMPQAFCGMIRSRLERQQDLVLIIWCLFLFV